MRLSWIVQAGTAGHPQVYLYMRDGQITYKEKEAAARPRGGDWSDAATSQGTQLEGTELEDTRIDPPLGHPRELGPPETP